MGVRLQSAGCTLAPQVATPRNKYVSNKYRNVMYQDLPKSFRKGLTAVAVVAGLVLTSHSALAQSTATITISGTVLAVSSITATAATALTDAELTGGVAGKVMSTVTEKSNKHDGYKVTLKSANAVAANSTQAYMKGALGGNTDQINYTITYGGVAVTLNSGAGLVTSAVAKTPVAGVAKLLAITTTAGFWSTDTYTDTLTLTLVNN